MEGLQCARHHARDFKNIIIKTHNLLISSKQPHEVEHVTTLIWHMGTWRVQKVKVQPN